MMMMMIEVLGRVDFNGNFAAITAQIRGTHLELRLGVKGHVFVLVTAGALVRLLPA